MARNFVLDEGVVTERAASYASAGCTVPHRDLGDWKMLHAKYLKGHVFLPTEDDGPPSLLDPTEPDEMPETFRHIDKGSPFLGTSATVMLVRVEELRFVADSIGEPPDLVRSLVRKVLGGGKSRNARDERALNDVLERWFCELDQRPVFAAFWEDVKDLFALEPAKDQDGWADILRDRMGLAHFDPQARTSAAQEILVFRYPVSALPRIKGTGGKRRPLVTPTVLDGTFSDAFCPSPRGCTTGHVINLKTATGSLRREVLHPRLAFRASHLWRLGTLRRGVDHDDLHNQRAVHLLMIRDETGRQDYADGTDWDLFQ